jgi:hypothetical protein
MNEGEDSNKPLPPERMAPMSGIVEPASAPMPTWLKVTLIIVVGVPLGLVALAGLVLGACLLGAR